jgi:hypothetical protein
VCCSYSDLWSVVTSYLKSSINPVTNPNPVSSDNIKEDIRVICCDGTYAYDVDVNRRVKRFQNVRGAAAS